jgi:nicotinamidase-related amidase
MLLDPTQSQLILIDYQERLMPALHGHAGVLKNAHILAGAAGLLDIPIWGTEQNPDRLGTMPDALRRACSRVFPKMSFAAAQAGLQDALTPAPAKPQGNARSLPRHLQQRSAAAPERQSLVLAGCEAHVCLLQTALELAQEEWDVWVVTDACSSRTERNRDAAFDRLAGAGIELVTTEMVVFEWLQSAEHPLFKQVQALVK